MANFLVEVHLNLADDADTASVLGNLIESLQQIRDQALGAGSITLVESFGIVYAPATRRDRIAGHWQIK